MWWTYLLVFMAGNISGIILIALVSAGRGNG